MRMAYCVNERSRDERLRDQPRSQGFSLELGRQKGKALGTRFLRDEMRARKQIAFRKHKQFLSRNLIVFRRLTLHMLKESVQKLVH